MKRSILPRESHADLPTVVLIGSIDTKGREYAYVRQVLIDAGVLPHVVDFGILGEPAFQPDTSARMVARAGGMSLEALRKAKDRPGARSEAISIMEAGVRSVVTELFRQGRCDAVLGLGGGQGSTVISAAMRALPVGLPKLLVSTMTPTNIGLYFGVKDIAVMYAVTDIAGLNRVSRRILRNAATAAAGMALHVTMREDLSRPLVAITMFGTTTRGVLRVQARVEAAGFETIVFHAVGSGGRAMEEMIDDGLIDGVIDYTPSELTDEHLGGIFTSGPTRLEAAGRRGIPQVVVPGAMAQITFGPLGTVPDRYLTPDRKRVIHNPSVTVVRANASECAELGRLLATKVNRSRGPVAVAIPLGGLSEYEAPGAALADEDADQALFRAIDENLSPDIHVRRLPYDINSTQFADSTADMFLALWQKAASHVGEAALVQARDSSLELEQHGGKRVKS